MCFSSSWFQIYALYIYTHCFQSFFLNPLLGCWCQLTKCQQKHFWGEFTMSPGYWQLNQKSRFMSAAKPWSIVIYPQFHQETSIFHSSTGTRTSGADLHLVRCGRRWETHHDFDFSPMILTDSRNLVGKNSRTFPLGAYTYIYLHIIIIIYRIYT